MKTEKLMSTFAILLISLSVVGVAYAAWFDTVTIEGTVHMGELIVGWYDTEEFPLTWVETTNGVPEEAFVPAKPWVCNATIDLSEEETSVHHDPPETVYRVMSVLVENAYPQWDLEIYGWLKNAGTIPAKIVPFFTLDFYDFTDDEPLGFEVTFEGFDGEKSVKEGAIIDSGPDGVLGTEDDVAIINFVFMLWSPDPEFQMEPCTEYPVTIIVDFKQEAEECHTYTFDVEIVAVQWNKIDEFLPV